MRNPVHPTRSAIAEADPLDGEFIVRGGFWGRWRERNASASIDHGIDWMERAGYLHNLRLADGSAHGDYRGPHWMDSDLHKLLEAIAWVPADARDPAHAEFYEQIVELLQSAQLDDGYLNSYYQTAGSGRRWTDFAFGHEMYLGGHLIQAGVAGHRNFGDDRLLTVGTRFADHLWDRFGRDGESRIDGHPEIEMALVELYRTTGEEQHLELAKLLVDRRGYSSLGPGHFGLLYCQDATPIREMRELDGHAVRALYYAAGATDVAVETGDQDLLNNLETLWDDLVATKSFVTGGVGSRHFHEAIGDSYELPPDRAYCESCASIGKIMWSHRLHLATGKASFAAEAERVLYNGFAASTSADRTHFWYRNPLYQREAITPAPTDSLLEERIDIGTRASWYDTSCCPPNIMRTVASLDSYLASMSGDVLNLNHLVPGEVRATIAQRDVTLEIQTGFPTAGGVSLRLLNGLPQRVRVRIPEWAEAASVHGDMNRRHVAAGEYAEVLVGTEYVHIDIPLTPRLVFPDRRIEAVAGQVAVARGPVIHAFEALDLDDPNTLHDLVVSTADAPAEHGEATDLDLGPDLLVVGGVMKSAAPASPYGPRLPEAAVKPLMLRSRPYATWANRGATAMRVWTPAD
ncbi:glycoside hydrolase family 127 protein [Microbacterium sp.]|uniref:glycoside hydrolase family 127 protein n=1 Tax=Microbacterium sp. TaxID=51671 RepID=UPI003F6F8E34